MIVSEHVKIGNLPKTDLHMHTCFCDGKNTPEEMVQAAVDRRMECIGFSGHSFVAFDAECGMNERESADYRAEVNRLKEQYRDRIRIYCGIELDYHSEMTDYHSLYDYVIGSVHYIPAGDGYAAVDDTLQIFRHAVETWYDGDYYEAAREYFRIEADVVNRTDCDIIGHFDLFSKFNEKEKLFNEQDPRYIAAWKKALDILVPQGRLFEINTGAVSRGWRSCPYPSPEMISYIRKTARKAGLSDNRFVLSSDSHRTDTIGFGFSEELLKGIISM